MIMLALGFWILFVIRMCSGNWGDPDHESEFEMSGYTKNPRIHERINRTDNAGVVPAPAPVQPVIAPPMAPQSQNPGYPPPPANPYQYTNDVNPYMQPPPPPPPTDTKPVYQQPPTTKSPANDKKEDQLAPMFPPPPGGNVPSPAPVQEYPQGPPSPYAAAPVYPAGPPQAQPPAYYQQPPPVPQGQPGFPYLYPQLYNNQ